MLWLSRSMSKMVRTMPALAANVSIDFGKKYEEAVNTLNTLQSNAQTIEKIRSQRNKMSHLNIPNMIKYASRAGISLDDIDGLNVIHVSGTKGKGSTCALTESILHSHGYKTGFFSSPHLVEVRERFRINGVPISREKFAEYFWEVYNKLDETKKLHNDTMPAYFAFCTIMALHVFLKERTDVAIMEVGIGGEYDSTNFIRKPVVCGVTSLGIDHTSILGSSIDKIAWHKAGIFKPGVPAFTVPQHPSAFQVLQDRAKEIGAPVYKVPSLQSFETEGRQLQLGIAGTMQRVNAALALQLCKTWMDRKSASAAESRSTEVDSTVDGSKFNITEYEVFPLTQQMVDGLKHCKWAGRNQTIKKVGLTYYLDGAHTVESIQQCVEWFRSTSEEEAETISGKVVKVIVFNMTGDRDPCSLMEPLKGCEFDAAVFCPNLAFSHANTADLTNNTVTMESQHKRCLVNRDSWIKVHQSYCSEGSNSSSSGNRRENFTSSANGYSLTNGHGNGTHIRKKISSDGHCSEAKKLKLSGAHEIMKNGADINDNTNSAPTYQDKDKCDKQPKVNYEKMLTQVFSCIYDAIAWSSQGRDPLVQDSHTAQDIPENLQNAAHIQILVTGSLHLVGGVLRTVGPDYN